MATNIDLQRHFEAFASFSGPKSEHMEHTHFVNMCKELGINSLSDSALESIFKDASKDSQGKISFIEFQSHLLPQLAQRANLTQDQLTRLIKEHSPRSFDAKVQRSTEGISYRG
jgi:Ca2+-binding EF-hand superfamily protein